MRGLHHAARCVVLIGVLFSFFSSGLLSKSGLQAAAAVQHLQDYMAFKIGITQFTGHRTIAEALQQMNRADSPEFLAGLIELAASKVGDGVMNGRKHDLELMTNPTPDGLLGLAMRLIAIKNQIQVS